MRIACLAGKTSHLALVVLMLPLAVGCQQPRTRQALDLKQLTRLDPARGVQDSKTDLLWYDATLLPVEGRGWSETEDFYDRLPAKSKNVVRPGVWGLSKNSAGLCVRFVTDSDRVAARWTTTSKNMAMDHMPATGVSGLDLYVRDGGQWRWVAVGRARSAPTNESVLAKDIPSGAHEYMLYLPLYNGIKSLEIGVVPKATLARARPRPAGHDRPMCFYGTSITQGGCAPRPGMVYTAILGRWLDRPVINLGFSGNGRMDPELAVLLGEIDASIYVLDTLPNMTKQMVEERLESFVKALRKARPQTPIVLVESVPYQGEAFLTKQRQAVADKNAALRKAYENLRANGVDNLVYVTNRNLTGIDGEGSVDGVHLTDLGYLRFAKALEPVLRKALQE
ncbi:MAG: SGNH/GDSL hydrolase family protein [Phycisphaerae bacterium]